MPEIGVNPYLKGGRLEKKGSFSTIADSLFSVFTAKDKNLRRILQKEGVDEPDNKNDLYYLVFTDQISKAEKVFNLPSEIILQSLTDAAFTLAGIAGNNTQALEVIAPRLETLNQLIKIKSSIKRTGDIQDFDLDLTALTVG